MHLKYIITKYHINIYIFVILYFFNYFNENNFIEHLWFNNRMIQFSNLNYVWTNFFKNKKQNLEKWKKKKIKKGNRKR